MNGGSRPVGKTTGRVPATQGAERGCAPLTSVVNYA